MPRAKFQVLVIPFILEAEQIKYCVFKRADMGIWQFIAGGGEADETLLEAAQREANEEAGIAYEQCYYTLDSLGSIPIDCFREEDRKRWGEDCFIVPEYSFAVKLEGEELSLSREHIEYKWLGYGEARKLLRYDSNKTALGELNARIKKNKLRKA